ncbi:MAG: hypothetical protein NWF14_04375 [Candidatus Bathyarchaeota archaeon]|nr:hypothetical protein [Candidatus Bathyarchaeota archaeon]
MHLDALGLRGFSSLQREATSRAELYIHGIRRLAFGTADLGDMLVIE